MQHLLDTRLRSINCSTVTGQKGRLISTLSTSIGNRDKTTANNLRVSGTLPKCSYMARQLADHKQSVTLMQILKRSTCLSKNFSKKLSRLTGTRSNLWQL
jgi:hypothetical protein